MAMSGFICHDDYYDRLLRLTNEEVGSLFRKLMLYHAGRFDEMGDFIGIEGIAFDFISNDIERMELKNEINSKNGSKGGRPRKQTEPTESEENRKKPNETEKNRKEAEETEEKRTKGYKDKDKEKDKDKTSSSSYIDEDDAAEIQSDHNRIFDAAEDAGFKMSNDVRASLIDLYAQYGLEKVLEGFRSCVDHGATTLAYLRACLKGDPKKPRAVKMVVAQQYGQRDYSSVDEELSDELDREMDEYMKKECGS